MDINKIPRQVESSNTEESSETNDSAQLPIAESKAGIGEIPDRIVRDASINPMVALIEQQTVDPNANPFAPNPVGEAKIPDDLLSVDPTKNLPKQVNLDQGLTGLPGLELRTSPNHFGIDLSAGGIIDGTLLDKVMDFVEAQRGGSGSPAVENTFQRPGMALYSAGEKSGAEKVWDAIVDFFKNLGMTKAPPLAGEALALLEAPGMVQDVTGDSKDFVRGISEFFNLAEGKHYNQAVEDAFKDAVKYVNPDADTSNIHLTPDQVGRLLKLIQEVNTKPSNEGDPPPINPEQLDPYDPKSHPLVIDKNPEYMEANFTPEDAARVMNTINSAEGPDVDPELANPPPTELPEGGPKPGGLN